MKRLLLACMTLISVIICACAMPEKKEEAKVFYPEPPDLPRIQFLASYMGSKDIEPQKSAFDVFLTGGRDKGRFLVKPYGVAVYGGKIYVCDTMQSVMVFDFEKKTFGVLQGDHGPGKLVQPLNISIDKAGSKYVTDPARGQVVVYDKNDFFVKAIGTPGNWRPVDAAVFEDQLYVVDLKNAAIEVFDRNTGERVQRLGDKGPQEDRLSIPTNIAFDQEGYMYISDLGRFQIVKLDRDGHVVATIGRLGTEASTFARPKGIAIDRTGYLYAVDAAFDAVQMFDYKRRLLLLLGKPGVGPGDLELPAKVAIDYDNIKYFAKYIDPKFEVEYIIVVTSQLGDHMVNVYGFGKERGKKYLTDDELAAQLREKLEKMKKEGSETKPTNEGGVPTGDTKKTE